MLKRFLLLTVLAATLTPVGLLQPGEKFKWNGGRYVRIVGYSVNDLEVLDLKTWHLVLPKPTDDTLVEPIKR